MMDARNERLKRLFYLFNHNPSKYKPIMNEYSADPLGTWERSLELMELSDAVECIKTSEAVLYGQLNGQPKG